MKQHSQFILIDSDRGDTFCTLDSLEANIETSKIYHGHSLAKKWPKNAWYPMVAEPNTRKQPTELPDFRSGSNSVVASKRLQEFFLREKVPNIELLPVKIYDQKKHLASKEYAIVHAVSPQDCLDSKASGVEWNPLNTKQVLFMKKLVIQESKVVKSALLFRVQGVVNLIFMRRDFFEHMAQQGFTGFVSWELTDYPG